MGLDKEGSYGYSWHVVGLTTCVFDMGTSAMIKWFLVAVIVLQWVAYRDAYEDGFREATACFGEDYEGLVYVTPK